MTHLLTQYGLVLLFVLIAVESAGVPLPGETALITAAFLSSPHHGHFNIVAVVVVAAAAAIIGDNLGYALGRYGGRALLNRRQFAARYADRVLPPAERFFRRHGGKTVFFGRFIAFLRFTAAWLAGITRMHWWQFFLWNAAGGIVWATGVGLLAYYAGEAAAEAVARYGFFGIAGLAAIGVIVFGVLHLWRRRMERG